MVFSQWADRKITEYISVKVDKLSKSVRHFGNLIVTLLDAKHMLRSDNPNAVAGSAVTYLQPAMKREARIVLGLADGLRRMYSKAKKRRQYEER